MKFGQKWAKNDKNLNFIENFPVSGNFHKISCHFLAGNSEEYTSLLCHGAIVTPPGGVHVELCHGP